VKQYPSVAAWLADRTALVDECTLLIDILHQTGMDEAIKWGSPTWVDGGHNVANLGLMRGHVVVGFFRGALLSDPEGQLVTPGVSRHTRFLEFTDLDDIAARRDVLEAYLAEAIARTRAGETVPRPDPGDLELCDELLERMDADPAFAEAFWGMTPGRRRGHAIHINGAKTEKGRRSRVEAATARVLAGKGRQECICGRSQRMPRCDGSHGRRD
jgi:uncharacterized protein YdeI (YjbR/CyaY-like superfamily)